MSPENVHYKAWSNTFNLKYKTSIFIIDDNKKQKSQNPGIYMHPPRFIINLFLPTYILKYQPKLFPSLDTILKQ